MKHAHSDPRIRVLCDGPPSTEGEFVLYWMVAARRIRSNPALERAIAWARELDRPLVVFEPLRVGYPWASVRHHRFVLEGMVDNERGLKRRPVTYYPYVEPEPGAGKGLLAKLAERACVVVTDDRPDFFYPRLLGAAAKQLAVRLEAVDAAAMFPFRATPRDFTAAVHFRRYLQSHLPDHLTVLPREGPLHRVRLQRLPALPEPVVSRWPMADLRACLATLDDLPIDSEVPACAGVRGGSSFAQGLLEEFVGRLDTYGSGRNQPDHRSNSELSAHLHFGHIGPHEVFTAVAQQQRWSLARLGPDSRGARAGWWGMSEGAETFLDQLITWRELGLNMCTHRDDYDRFESLPEWARRSLEEHAVDERPHLYTLDQFEAAATHDPIWNAAQNQLRQEGRIHNYLRMLWGKKILHWSTSPEEALEIMVHLNNRWALDGRDANSYSGIFWCLGRYDRAWGPTRPVFGSIRYMSSKNTTRKLRLASYLERYGSVPPQAELFDQSAST